MAKAIATYKCPDCGATVERRIDGFNRRDAFSPPDFDPLTEQVKSLSALQRADVMKYIEFIKSRS